MKKAFGTTHEATENHSEFDIIQLTKDLLFHQKQIEVENKQKANRDHLEKEIEEANKFTGVGDLKKKRREDVLASVEELEDYTDEPDECDDPNDDTIDDADEFDDDETDLLNEELNRLSEFFSIYYCILTI